MSEYSTDSLVSMKKRMKKRIKLISIVQFEHSLLSSDSVVSFIHVPVRDLWKHRQKI